MWNSTTVLGAGTSIGTDNCHYLVIKYNPKGNIPGEITSNVFDKTQGMLHLCNMHISIVFFVKRKQPHHAIAYLYLKYLLLL